MSTPSVVPSSSTSSSSSLTSPWLYFLAGSLLPTLAWWLSSSSSRHSRSKSSRRRNDDNDDNSDNDDDSDNEFECDDFEDAEEDDPTHWGPQDAPYKMILVVNQELKGMGNGKKMAQCCHAAVGCYKWSQKHCPNAVKWWERTGCAKIAVKCPTEKELWTIYQTARQRRIPCYLVEDAGRTQIAAGSRTVLGLGPAPARVYEGLTSHLKLV